MYNHRDKSVDKSGKSKSSSYPDFIQVKNHILLRGLIRIYLSTYKASYHLIFLYIFTLSTKIPFSNNS